MPQSASCSIAAQVSLKNWHPGYFSWLLLFASFLASAEVITGFVVSVHDGDTITLQTPSENRKIRLAGIDAPELRQRYGLESRHSLQEEILRQTVTVNTEKQDKYGRFIGKVMLGGEDINLKQINNGLAWVYIKYLSELAAEDRSTYLNAQEAAQQARLGLWKDDAPTSPWDYRRRSTERQAR
jgi:endonuclease YncB( thermonuclease family)